ncbi:MAG: PQQ-binding-like beta-propeller repeat protein [Planctomycetes bacterium]|nr:PQQ-binding-like beta-propeller repeat protein [Planctomycetota bacterium]
MKALHRTVFKAAAALCVVATGAGFAVHADDPPEAKQPAPAANAQVLDLAEASIPVSLPGGAALAGDARTFMLGHTTDDAWMAKVAGNNPRSPAAQDGVVVVGSGSGAQVYGYAASTGKLKWTATSKDSGISNILVSLGHAYYTTYSCTLERVRIADGNTSYSHYLAPTVTCAPDVKDELVAASYRNGSKWNVSLHTADKGTQKWKADVGNQTVLTAPVLTEDGVFIASADGGVTCLEGNKGKKQWTAEFGAVSAPVPTKWGLLVTTTWDGQGGEGARPADKAITPEERKRHERETVTKAEEQVARTMVAANDRRVAIVDDPSQKPAGKSGSKVSGPSGGLDFQGLRPGVGTSRIYFAYSGNLVAVDPLLGRAVWSVKFADKSSEFTRPVIARGLVFVAGTNGIVTAFEERKGAMVWSYKFKDTRFLAEPCVDGDHLFLTTGSGQLIQMPIGSDERSFRNAIDDENDVEGVASIYWKVQQAFRRVRNIVREVEDAPAAPDKPAPDANDNNNPRNTGPNGDGGPREALPPRDEEQEEISKGEWERREARKAERDRPNGKDYEEKPFRRD